MILDQDGQVVWFSAAANAQTFTDNFSVQSYRGKPVLTWWEGSAIKSGVVLYTTGNYTIANTSYTPIATVSAVGSGFEADIHECVLTPRGTAYIVALKIRNADLTAIGGPVNAPVLDNAVQEIDIATGELLFQWDGLEHIPVDETYEPYSSTGPTDLYHFNSIAIAPDGDLLVSVRYTWTVYKVSRATGAIVWRLGGKRSDFAAGHGAGFAWQHDAKLHGETVLSIFDNEASDADPHHGTQSRAIFLRLDTRSMRASLLSQYTRPGGVLCLDEGNVQLLDGGRVLVGWGDEPYLTEFSPDGQVLLDGQYPTLGGTPPNVYQSYRALSFDWSARPAESPAAAARPSGNGAIVYASWNGATEVARWSVLAGPEPSALIPAGTRTRTGFETGIPVASAGPYFVAVAEDTRGCELGRSGPVTLPQ